MRTLAAAAALAAAVAAGAAGAAPVPGGRPGVSGVLRVGERLAGTPGSWSGSGVVRYAYQWSRCDAQAAHCSSIHGATRATYRVVAADAGHTLGLTVRATDATGTTPAYAAVAGPVSPRGVLAATSQPAVAGTPAVGGSLNVSGGTWTSRPAATTTAWLRCNENARRCAPVAGATAATYTLSSADAGDTIVAAATATAGEATATVLSLPSPVVRAAPGPLVLAGPSVGGVLQQGRKLTGSAGSWSGSGAIRYAFGWYRCDSLGAHCSSVHGATAPTYTLVAKDAGRTLGFAVRATDSTGTTAAYAGLAGLVAAKGAAPVATAQPDVSGTAAPGSTVTVGAVAWSAGAPAASVAWLRCNANGRLCAPVPGAAAATYTVAAADAGHTLVAAVTAGGSTVLSRPTPVVRS